MSKEPKLALHLHRELGELSCSSLCYLRYLLFKFKGFDATKYVKKKNRTEGNKGNEEPSEVHDSSRLSLLLTKRGSLSTGRVGTTS